MVMNCNDFGSVTARVILSAAMVAIIAACQTTPVTKKEMSVQAASQVAVQFQKKYEDPPPRGFGAYVQLYVDRYHALKPGALEKCSSPRHQITDEEINELSRGERGSHVIRRLAEEAFLDGSVDAALRLSDAVIVATEKSSHRSKALANKAFFLAMAGDPDAAQSALYDAERHYNDYRRGAGKGSAWAEMVLFEMARATAAINLAEGDVETAEIAYYQALSHYEKVFDRAAGAIWEFPKWRSALVKAELSRTLRLQGRLNEAEIWAREAFLEDDYRVKPVALLSLSEIYFARQEYDMARQLALTARNLTIDRCVSVEALLRARTRAVHAQTLMALEQWGAAADEFDMIQEEMRPDPEAFARSYRDNTDWGLAMIMSGKAQAAIVQLERARKRAVKRYGFGHYNVREAEALRGVALASAGEVTSARRQLNSAVPQLLSRWREAQADNIGGAFRKIKLRLIVETYIDLLTSDGDRRSIEKAFVLAGTVQAQSVGKSLAASAARTAVKNPELAELIRQRQDLERRAATFQNRMSSAEEVSDTVVPPAVMEQLKAELAELNGALAALDEEIKSRFPRYAAIVNPGTLSVGELREHMKLGESIVVFFVGIEQSYVWAFGQSGPVAFSVIPMGRADLATAVNHLRKALDPPGIRQLSDIPDFDVKTGYALYQVLLEPVATGWQQASSIMVIPDGPLGMLPLTVLPTTALPLPKAGKALFANHREISWLARTHAVTLLPSVSALVTLRTLHEGTPRRRALAAFANPVFSKAQATAGNTPGGIEMASRGALHRRGIRITEKTSLDDATLNEVNLSMLQPLPDTADEVLGVAEALGADAGADVFLGEKAAEGTVKAMDLKDRRVLVFATHGLIPGDLDGLREPALALSAPEVTGEKDADGLLTMGEVMGLSIDADWVVLSACNTAAGDGAGAEAVSGLGQAFFYAGARSLLVTGWPVETTSARALTTDLFQRQQTNPEVNRARALKATMNAMMDGPGGDGFTYAHPLFWAPYILVGDGS